MLVLSVLLPALCFSGTTADSAATKTGGKQVKESLFINSRSYEGRPEGIEIAFPASAPNLARHLSSTTVCEERLENGRLIGRYWSATGRVPRRAFLDWTFWRPRYTRSSWRSTARACTTVGNECAPTSVNQDAREGQLRFRWFRG